MEQLDPDPFLEAIGQARPALDVEDARCAHGAERAAPGSIASRRSTCDACLRRASSSTRRARGEPRASSPASRRASGAKILLALKGFAQWSHVPAGREVPRRHLRERPHEARLGARGARRRGPRLRAGVHRGATCASSLDALRSRRVQLAGAVAAVSAARASRCVAGRISASACASTPSIRRSRSRSTIPARPCSRLGTTRASLRAGDLDGIDGLHFHTLCEQDIDAARAHGRRVRGEVRRLPPGMKWVNFGGGHHITRARLRGRRPGPPVRDFRAAAQRPGLPRAGRGDRARRRRARRGGAGPRPQRHADRDPRHLGDRAHARRARDAVPRR